MGKQKPAAFSLSEETVSDTESSEAVRLTLFAPVLFGAKRSVVSFTERLRKSQTCDFQERGSDERVFLEGNAFPSKRVFVYLGRTK